MAKNRDSGLTSEESLKKSSRRGSSSKTFQRSVGVDSLKSSEILPPSGMMRNGILSALPTSVRLIDESDYSSLHGEALASAWPTPTETDSAGSARETNATIGERTSHKGTTLTDAVRLWPTPIRHDGDAGAGHGKNMQGAPSLRTVLSEEKRLWPTPAASMPNTGEDLENWEARRQRMLALRINGNGISEPLAIALAKDAKNWTTPTHHDGIACSRGADKRSSETLPGQLASGDSSLYPNPAWVTSLMGFPDGWLDLDGRQLEAKRSTNGSRRERVAALTLPGFEPSATPSSRRRRT